jgi:uncharacterized surface protein with fasciclin (FAS1) repeats
MKAPFLSLAGVLALAVGPAARPVAADDPCAPAAPAPASKTAPATKDLVETAKQAGSFQTLLKAAEVAGLVGVLQGPGPFTVFAPTDEAFAKVPAATLEALLADKAALAQVLTYHVVAGAVPASEVGTKSFVKTVQGQSLRVTKEGDAVRIDGARVLAADVPATNGIIHVIDHVVLPRPDLVETAVKAESFQTLVAAVQAAGLVEALQGEGPFTVFAPNDAAFAQLPEGTVKGLLADLPRLKGVLTYHVIAGRALSTDLPVGTTHVETLAGQKLEIVKDAKGQVTVQGTKVIAADVLAGNGIIHVLGGVLLPDPR